MITPENAMTALERVAKFVDGIDEIVKDVHKNVMLESTKGAVHFNLRIVSEYIMKSHPDKLKTWEDPV